MGEKTWSPESILDVFGDSVARATLVYASDHPVTVNDICDRLDVSAPTIYRRVEPLVEANLLVERQRIDSGGNQPTEYLTNCNEVIVAINTGGFTVDVEFQQDVTRNFEAPWTGLERTRYQL